MSLQGNLSGFSLAEIFRMISFSAKTGNLVIARDSSQGRVHFREGEVYFATTPDNRLPLGLRLVDSGLITREHLDGALAAQNDDSSKRLGEILVSRGLLAHDALADFVREQIQDALFEIFEWDDGTYYFEPATDTDEDIGLALSVDEIVVEAERRRHEWDEIRKLLPSMECRVRLSTNAVALSDTVELDPHEWAAICHVADGADLHALRSLLHLTSLGLCRMVARMILRGVLEVTALEVEPKPQMAGVQRETYSAPERDFEYDVAEPAISAGVIQPDQLIGDADGQAKVGAVTEEYGEQVVAEELVPADVAPEAADQSAIGAVEAERPFEASVTETEEPLSEIPEELEPPAGDGDRTDADSAGQSPREPDEAEASPLTAIRKYIRDASDSSPATSRKDYPIEWLTYYGRLNHRRSKAPSERQLNSKAYRGLVVDKS